MTATFASPALLDTSLAALDAASLTPEAPLLRELIAQAALGPADRDRIAARGADLVRRIRSSAKPGLMEIFLAEYGLSTEEGIALMCLAEALLRVPDATTIDALIEDKIAPSDWSRHLGRSASPLVNASTWALLLTGRVLDEREPGLAGTLRGAMRRLGEPVIRAAASRAMKEMGRQFVLGETIGAGMERAARLEAQGYSYSYDMLGEAARTGLDAKRYAESYGRAIAAIAKACKPAAKGGDVRDNPGISVKFSALHPRYEVAQQERVMAELVPVVRDLARAAAQANMGFTVDAEEADRLTLSLMVIEEVLKDPELAGWDGFGVVVQGYGRRCGMVIDWLHDLAGRYDRRIMLRLVKGAYWDAEVKRAQVLGLPDFPVFTRKAATDVSYISNARKLLGLTDRIYPMFAGHNAHTVAAILDMAGGDTDRFEFQRLHGMGERLHDIVHRDEGTRCRIYAPVGAHRDLLAYLVRRLLENGANSSFVNQIVDESVPPETVASCPFAAVEALLPDRIANPAIRTGPDLFPGRKNSEGYDLTDAATLGRIAAARAPHAHDHHLARPLLAGPVEGGREENVQDPATGKAIGRVISASAADVETAVSGAAAWTASPAERAEVLNRAADLYEAEFGTAFALLALEAGKSQADAVAELREAVDFLRYYAGGIAGLSNGPRGTFACISPWNFPLAIFTGQVAAALAAGNAVLAKPAEQTPLIACHAVSLLHRAGVPQAALQLLPGDGPTVGAALTSDPRIAGVAFTGSTATAQAIRKSLAAHCAPGTPLIAETGGLNAMIVDSTALPEQAVRDIVASAFQSAGQRCSALRCLYLQQDIAPHVLEMLYGAMEELTLGAPWDLTTDVGPVIDAEALETIRAHVETARAEGRLLKELPVPQGALSGGTFAAPAVIRVNGIADLGQEIFGPVLHVATFRARDLPKVTAAINDTGYGLTFGLHSRIDDRVDQLTRDLCAGNIYVNRNQIGAVVGSQPFGGEGLSGTGPKAGGPDYLPRFCAATPAPVTGSRFDGAADTATIEAALTGQIQEPETTPGDALRVLDLPGPTGESNRLHKLPRRPVLCLGPGTATALAQAEALRKLGGQAVVAGGNLAPEALTTLQGLSGAIWWGDAETAAAYDRALAARDGAILPLITALPDRGHALLERHVCIDTTASGGNAELLAEAGSR